MKKTLIAMIVLLGVMLLGGAAYAMNTPREGGPAPQMEGTAGSGHASLGIVALNNNPQIAHILGLSVTDGVVITQATGESAKQAGLQRGDLVTAIDGQAVHNLGSLQSYLAQKAPGLVVTLTYLRQGATQTAQVTLSARPEPVAPPGLGKADLRLLKGLPLERLISSTTVLKGDDGQPITVKAYGGTVSAVQLPSGSNLGSLTVQPLDGSPAETIALGEGVFVLKGKHPVALSAVQVNDRVVVARDIVNSVMRHTVVLVGVLTFGPGEDRGGPPPRAQPEGRGHRGPQGLGQPPHGSFGKMMEDEDHEDGENHRKMAPQFMPTWNGGAPQTLSGAGGAL